MNKKKNYMRDGMLGLVTGDALGVPVQFCSREAIAERPAGPVTGMEGFGTYNMPPGTWSDDSSMALASLESILRLGRVDPQDIMDNFLRWEFEGEFTPFGYAFDEGNTCSTAIWNYRNDRNWQTCGKTGDHANGNGALMRILPVCIWYTERQKTVCTSDDEAVEAIHNVTMLTHNHLRAKIASGLYYFMVKSIIRAKEAEPDNLQAPDRDDAANVSAYGLTPLLQQGLDEGFAYYRQDFRNLAEMVRYSRLFDLGRFRTIPEEGIKGSGYVVDALEAAVWCLIMTDSLQEALLKAVNLGDDTDTTAAIAGGLAGLYYGCDAIPAEWIRALQRKEWLEEMITADA